MKKYRKKDKQVYEFRQGERFELDQIYNIQGLAGGDWWERVGDDLGEYASDMDMDLGEYASDMDMDLGDSLICIRNVRITIIIESD